VVARCGVAAREGGDDQRWCGEGEGGRGWVGQLPPGRLGRGQPTVNRPDGRWVGELEKESKNQLEIDFWI
jgi:hypothetical protein